ncbi:MAG: hypothetical protein WC011_03770 [Candidatus Paceibacterota bacterium]
MNKKLPKYFKKSLVSILILSIFSAPFLGVSKVYAQLTSSNQAGSYSSQGQYPTGNSITGGIGGYVQILGPAIQELPHCRNAIASSWAKNLFGNNSYAVDDIGRIFDREDAKKISSDLSSSESIPVADFEARAKLEKIDKKEQEQLEQDRKRLENELCLKSIGQMIVKMLLQKLTVSTVEWINNGFDGKPLFLQDPGQFFGDIAKNEILQFKLEIDNPTLYPFGRDFLKSLSGTLNNRFAQNARYSANELIQRTTPEYSSTTFSADFSKGGWNAWTALTQVPANNPIGFNIITSNELAIRLEGTSSSSAQKAQVALDQSGGFLGDQRCAQPKGITREQHRAALIKGERELEEYTEIAPGDNEGDLDQYVTKTRPTGKVIGICEKWEYVTPGKLIAEAATKVVSYPDNNLLKADDLNAAIAAIMDALLNRWSQDLANKGFASFSNDGASGGFIIDGDNRTSGATSQTELDFPKTALGTNWLRENSDFNIRTDLTQAVIDEQRIYQRKLLEQNQVLDDLITTVYQLDYCIPGPHPGFEEDSRRTLNAVKNTIPSKTASDFEDITKEQIVKIAKAGAALGGAAIGASLGTAVLPIVGTAVGAAIGVLTGAIIDWVAGDNNEDKLEAYYSAILKGYTGIHTNEFDKAEYKAGIRGKQDITNAMDSMLDRYIKLMNRYYKQEFLPTVTPSARIEFRKVPGYRKTIESNEYAASVLEGVIVRLAKLKDELDTMNPAITPGANKTYNDYLPLINEFARLSASMVTGNDIGKVTDDIREYSSQIKYVYDDLLTGPYGCEKELHEDKSELEKILKQTLRAEYPFKIWYDYNTLGPNVDIPAPTELRKYNIVPPNERLDSEGRKKPANQMPSYHQGPFSKASDAFGPGFLSSVAMNWSKPQDWPKPQSAEVEGCQELINNHHDYKSYTIDCLLVGDLFFHVNQWPVSVGRKQGLPLSGEKGANINEQKDVSFEQTIGVY